MLCARAAHPCIARELRCRTHPLVSHKVWCRGELIDSQRGPGTFAERSSAGRFQAAGSMSSKGHASLCKTIKLFVLLAQASASRLSLVIGVRCSVFGTAT